MILLALSLLATPSLAATRGAEAFRTCAACHDQKPGALGPDLKGVVGRKAGALAGFRFSGPLKRSNIVWSKDTLRAFLINPQAVIPGNRMPYSGATERDAADITEYLLLDK